MTPEGVFLIVEDDIGAARILDRVLQRYRKTCMVSTLQEGREKLGRLNRCSGIVVDIGLPDGSGLDLVRFVRPQRPLLPILVLTGRNDPKYINLSHQLRAEFVCKPISDAALEGFARRAIAAERVPDQRVSRVVEEISRRRQLTARETDVLATAMTTGWGKLRSALGVSQNTLKSLVRQVLRKTQYDTIEALTKAVLHEALSGSDTSGDGSGEPWDA